MTLQYRTGLPKAITLQYKDDVLKAIACRVTQKIKQAQQKKNKTHLNETARRIKDNNVSMIKTEDMWPLYFVCFFTSFHTRQDLQGQIDFLYAAFIHVLI